MKKAITVLFLFGICLLVSACVPGPAFVVNSSGDEPDIYPGDGICETVNNECTLRAAIREANVSDDESLITFENVTQINPTSDLPTLTASNTHINGKGVITIDGTLCGENCTNGIYIKNSSYNIIQGMIIRYFSRGIYIYSAGGTASNNRIGLLPTDQGDGSQINRISNNGTGLQILGQNAFNNFVTGNHFRFNEFSAISIGGGAHNTLIGTTTGTGVMQGWNWIASNYGVGVRIGEGGNNHITGNLIGTSKNGNSPLGNSIGIRLTNSSNNVIGITSSGEGLPNVISNSTFDGINIGGSDHNIVAGNFIGTNLAGTTAMPNRRGVYITGGSSSNIIGTNGDGINDTAEGNLISGNLDDGVYISSTNSIKNVIAGNYIGTNFDGTAAIGNGGYGITVSGDLNLIGTNGDGVSDSLEANIISGNHTGGIFLASFNCIVAGNYIGVDKTGTNALGNVYNGITINVDSSSNIIGTDGDGIADAAERNIISGNGVGMNGSAGIDIDGDNNVVAGNFIGTDATGNSGLGNLQYGITLSSSASGNLIGTDGDGVADVVEGNLISGNGSIGIWLSGTYNTVAGNWIGTDITGTAAIPNMHTYNELVGAVHLNAGALGNVIGTNSDGSNDAAEGNLISGNARLGISIRGPNTYLNIVAGNKIGTDISGSSALGNFAGITVYEGTSLNQIGTDGDGNSDIAERNLISGNTHNGISMRGTQNQIAGNFIGTDVSGTADLGNGGHGVFVNVTSTEIVIGGSVPKANLIAFNGKDGIQVSGMDADKIYISHNSIHSNDESGIDLTVGQGLWFSPNDPGDIDLGPNDMMNFPVLNSATAAPALLAITGQIVDGLPNTNFVIHFYANDVCDSPGGHGEGKSFIGSTNEITDGSGNVSFLTSFASGVTAGQYITATASTDGKTSEFSACVEVADIQSYSQELEEDRCGQFEQEEMTLVTFGVNPELLSMNMYVKKPSGFPGSEEGTNGNAGEWKYTAFLGDNEARLCNFQGFPERLYCNFIIPEDLLNTSQELKVFLNDCGPPIYVNQNVTIFTKEPPSGCSSDMNERDCIAAGGEYTVGANCTCP